jgi:hypothetical protein
LPEVKRCPECSVPEQITRDRTWLNGGVIVQCHNMAHRACFIECENVDPTYRGVPEELEAGLGEDILAVAVDLQRRFAREKTYSLAESSDGEDLRAQLAPRGLGNLREFRAGAGGLRMRIDNSTNYLMIVGMAQGLNETAFDTETHVECELSPSGDLEIEAIPRA